MTVISTTVGQVQARAPDSPQTLWKPALPQPQDSGDLVAKDVAPVERRGLATNKSWAGFVAGGLGGMTAALLTSPLDVLKTRLQSDFYQSQLINTRRIRGIPAPETLPFVRASLLHFRETFTILFSIHRVEGWRALFKGLGPNLTGVVPASAIKFYTYGNAKRIYSNSLNGGKEAAWIHLLAGGTAGVVVSTVTNPIWLVKTRLQLDKSRANEAGSLAARRYKNSFDCIKQVVRQEGVMGLYRGLSASYLGVTESTLQWVLYEQMKAYLARREEKILQSGMKETVWDNTIHWGGKIGAAGSAKLVAALMTYPHEVVRTRLRQAPREGGHLKYTGLIQCFSNIWKEEGFAAMYGGLTPHLLRTVPNAAIMFGVYEAVMRLFNTKS